MEKLQVGKTPTVEVGGVIFKREDFNPTGSVKDRGLSYQIDYYSRQGVKQLAISSSGNAALAAAAWCRLKKIKLTAFVPSRISSFKLQELKKYQPEIIFSSRAKSDCIKFCRQKKIINLRPSTDPLGAKGYQSLAWELEEEVGKIDSIFFPVSSGTTLVGVAQGYQKLSYLPRLYVVQTTKIFPLASLFDQEFVPTTTSLAKALVARYTPRKKEVIDLVKKSKGWGWVVSDQQIKKALKWLKKRGILTSPEGGVALAGFWKAQKKGFKLGKSVCLLTGKSYEH